MRRVCGDEVLAGLERGGKRRLEERQGLRTVTARAEEPASLEIDPGADDGGRAVERLGLAEQPLAFVEAVAKPFEARELSEHLGASGRRPLPRQLRTEALLTELEIAEVPERAEAVAHRPHCRRPLQTGPRDCP